MAQAPRRPNPDRIVDAAMALAARMTWREVTLADIAAEAKVSLEQLNGAFRSKTAIVAALGDRVDRAVLAGIDAESAGEPARDRLLDVLMRRLEALGPYKDAVASIIRDSCRDPAAILCGGPRMVQRMAWCLEAAGISSAGCAGRVRAKGLAAIYASAIMVWLRDDSPEMGRTMAHLDRALKRAERLALTFSIVPRRRPSPGATEGEAAA